MRDDSDKRLVWVWDWVWVENRKQREERRAGSFALIAFLLNVLMEERDFAGNVIRNEKG